MKQTIEERKVRDKVYNQKPKRKAQKRKWERENRRGSASLRERKRKYREKRKLIAKTLIQSPENKSKLRNDQLIKSYGITQKKYEEILKKQMGVCEICGIKPNGKRLCVDHDHKTKKMRGIICSNCNLMLGNAKDNIIIMKKAIKYLEVNK